MTALPRLALTFVLLVLLAGLAGDLLEEGTVRHIAAIVATTTALVVTVAVLVRLARGAGERETA